MRGGGLKKNLTILQKFLHDFPARPASRRQCHIDLAFIYWIPKKITANDNKCLSVQIDFVIQTSKSPSVASVLLDSALLAQYYSVRYDVSFCLQASASIPLLTSHCIPHLKSSQLHVSSTVHLLYRHLTSFNPTALCTLTPCISHKTISSMESDSRRRSVKVVRVLCDGCERASAVAYCTACNESACSACAEQLHARARKTSKRPSSRTCNGRSMKDLQKSVGVLALCTECRSRPASVRLNLVSFFDVYRAALHSW